MKICRLRCALCRNGLLRGYEVYSADGESGDTGAPVFIGLTRGYFYGGRIRRCAEILEIAGDIAENEREGFRLLTFDGVASGGNLILINGVYYRVGLIREIAAGCRILSLEVYLHAGQN